MKALKIILPGLALGGAALLTGPGADSYAFTKIGGSLGTAQRDLRVFDNFTDNQANNNNSPDAMFPGALGAELAIWKSGAEWGSIAHGDGSGDPKQSVVGSGGANFEFAWMGMATGVGTTNNNIVSAISSCGGGVLAYTETPISDGWRIRYCENITWADGPDSIGGATFDIQGVGAHELGHALGLGHSGAGGATMAASIGSGKTGARSINQDDSDGAQCIYGVMAASKPTICEVEVVGSTLTIKGVNFDATNNTVWFTPAASTSPGSDPRVRNFNNAATNGGTEITLTIPAAAGPGEVLIKIPGATTGDRLSNAFPFDTAPGVISNGSASCGDMQILSWAPVDVPALVPGTGQFLTVTGVSFNEVQSIDWGFDTLDPGRWTMVDQTTITIDVTQANTLGNNLLQFNTAGGSNSVLVNVVAPTTPVLEMGTGDVDNPVSTATGVTVTVAGEPGEVHYIFTTTFAGPSVHPKVCFDIGGGNIGNLTQITNFVIPSKGWISQFFPFTYTASPDIFYTQSLDLTSTAKFDVSNVQTNLVSP